MPRPIIKDYSESPIPRMNYIREIELSQEQIDKIKYLLLYKGYDSLNIIANEALEAHLKEEFKRHNLEHFIDPDFEEQKRQHKIRYEEIQKEAQRKRLIEIAKEKLLNEQVQKLVAEEDRTGKRPTIEAAYPLVKVEMLKRVDSYGGLTLGQTAKIPSNVAGRWAKHYICKIIK